VRIQSSHHHVERGLDAHFSPPEATAALLAIEHGRLPRRLWEPAAGDGAIVQPLRAAHFDVVASDLVDYGGANIMVGVDYLTAPLPAGVTGIVKNPPYKLAVRFAARLSMRFPICRCCCGRTFWRAPRGCPFFARTRRRGSGSARGACR
jgi:hypothetical protein